MRPEASQAAAERFIARPGRRAHEHRAARAEARVDGAIGRQAHHEATASDARRVAHDGESATGLLTQRDRVRGHALSGRHRHQRHPARAEGGHPVAVRGQAHDIALCCRAVAGAAGITREVTVGGADQRLDHEHPVVGDRVQDDARSSEARVDGAARGVADEPKHGGPVLARDPDRDEAAAGQRDEALDAPARTVAHRGERLATRWRTSRPSSRR